MIKKLICVCALLVGMAATSNAQIKINEVQTSNSKYQDAVGDSGDWIELYNEGSSAVDIKGYFLTDNKDKPRKWEFTNSTTISAKGFLLVWCDGKNTTLLGQPHTNFKVSASGEAIRLYSNTMLLCDSVKVPLVERDFSYGRITDGSGEWALLKKPTYGKSNNGVGYFKGMAPQPQISLKGGWYSGSQSVTISNSLPGAVIRYTTDGAEPTDESPIYDGSPIEAKKTNAVTQKYGYNRANKTGIQNVSGWPAYFIYPDDRYKGNRDFNFVLKAKAFHPDYMTSNTAGETYFIDERKPTLPVISLSIDKKYLFSADSGLYIQGTNGLYTSYGAGSDKYNWVQDWAYPAHIEYFDANGVKQFANTMTIEVFGAVSRSVDLKSLALKCKNKYENTEINYPIFGSDGLPVYKSFILRNSGNDWADGNFARDAIIQQIVRGKVDLETQDYQPVVVFINGEYWSLMNMRERLSAEYFAGYHDYASDIDLLKNYSEVSEGDDVRYNELISLLGANAKDGEKANLSNNQELYDNLITNYVDADNIINYYIAQTYCDNGDWPNNNTRIWRPRVENGKFRFPLYDTDFGYGLWGNDNATLANAMSDTNEKYTWSTVIFRSLLTNAEFKAEFIQRYAYMLNTVYSDSRTAEIADAISNAIRDERDTYTNPEWARGRGSSWGITAMKDWNTTRIGSMRSQLQSHERLGNGNSYADYTVKYNNTQGTLQLCGMAVENNYTGKQMLNIPIRMTAIPADGYQFKHWKDGEGTVLSTEQEYSNTITAAATIEAVFEVRANVTPASLHINELMASNNSTIATEFGKYTDWFEIYNSGTTAVDLAGLYFSNNELNPTLYQIPYGNAKATTVPAEGILMFWASKDTYSGINHLPFKLNKDGGVIMLSQKNASGEVTIIDSLHYGTQNTDISFGRFPNGTKTTIMFENPTPGDDNETKAPAKIDNIYITEILAKNSSINREETGNYADWFELYNANSEDIDLGGLYVTNSFDDLNMYQIPRGQPEKTTIKAGKYMIMWADKQTAINPNHVDFKINAERCQLALVQVRGSENYIIDSVSFSNQGEDISYGRYPNYTSEFRYLATPTPEAKNVNTAPAKVSGITINELLAENTAVLKAEDGKYYDYVEFYNAGTSAVDLGGLFVSDSLGYPLRYRIQRNNPTATTIQPGEWLTFFASDSASLGTRHFSFALSSLSEDFVISQVTSNGIEQLDFITFGPQSANVSYGRFPETNDNWELMEPTPSAANISAESSVNLKTLLSSQGTITPEVSGLVLEYVCLLPSNVSTVPIISATAINERATVKITQATSTNGKASIVVTSANGMETATYTVTFANDPSSDASLKSLVASVGTLSPEFASNVYDYTLTFASSSKPLFTAIASNPNSNVEVIYGAKYSDPTIIRVTSENNTVQEYTIVYQSNPIEVSQWVDDFLNGIDRVKQVSSHYTLTYENDALRVHFVRGANDSDGYFEYYLPENTVVNAAGKELFVTIIAQTEEAEGVSGTIVGLKCQVVDVYGYQATYRPYDSHTVGLNEGTYTADFKTTETVDKSKIAAVRFVLDQNNQSSAKNKVLIIKKIVIGPQLKNVVELSNNADLATLSSNVGVLEPVFDANVLEYTVTLPAGTTTIPTITATTVDSKARLQISQAASLSSNATVTVISEDLLAIKNYSVRFEVTPSVVDGFTENILQPALLAWSENSSMYELSYSAGLLNIDYNRKANAGTAAIEYNVLAGENKILNLSNYPYFSIKIQSDVATDLRIDLFDVNGKTATLPAQKIAASTNFAVYTFDFTDVLATLAANKIYGAQLYFDAGAATAKKGTIIIDDMRFGSDVEIIINAAPVISVIPAQTVEQTVAFEPINLNNFVSDDNTAVSDLEWSVSAAENFTVSIVNNVATVAAKNNEWIGSEQITFTVVDEHNATATRKVRFTVIELVILVESLLFAEEELSILLGETQTIAATINPANATDKTLTYKSSNPLVVSVDELGTITALQEGKVTITATSANGETAQCAIEVLPILAETVTIIPASISLQEDEIAELTVKILPENTTHKTIDWKTHDNNIVNILSGNKIVAVAEGTTTIEASVNGITASCEVTVSKLTIPVESISLPTAISLEIDETQALSLTIEPENATNKTVSWTSSNSKIASVSSEGIVTGITAGTVEITALAANGKTASTTVTVQPMLASSITLSASKVTLVQGETETLTAEILPANTSVKTITWLSSNETVASVVDGEITALAVGTATISATTSNGKKDTCTITVTPIMVESVTLNASEWSLGVGQSSNLQASILPLNAADKSLTWTVDKSNIVSVDQNGLITAIAEGTATITVSSANGKTAKCVVEVVLITVPVESITIYDNRNLPITSLTLHVDDEYIFNAEVEPTTASNKSIIWKSSNETIATVNDGAIIALLDGQTQITAQSNNGITARVSVTVLPLDVEEILLTPQAAEVFVGEKLSIASQVLPEKAKNKTITWSSSNENIATVDKNGTVTTLAEGSVIITARSVNGIAKSTAITVKTLLPTNVTITNASDRSLLVGGTLQFDYSVFPANAETVITWESSDESVLTIDNNGLIKGIGVGKATVTVSTANGLTDSKIITVKPIEVTSIQILPSTLILAKGKTVAMPEIVILPANATDKTVTKEILDQNIAIINSSGLIQAIAPGNTRLTITAKSGSPIAHCSITVVDTDVDAQNISINGSAEVSLNLDATLNLSVTVEPANATSEITWTISNPEIATVSPAGVITALKPGTTTVTVTTSNGKTASKTIIVKEQLPQTVSIVGAKEKMVVGETIMLSALIEPENTTNKSVTWSVSSGKLSITNSGELTARETGMAMVTVTTVNGRTSNMFISIIEKPIISVTNIEFTDKAGNMFLNQTKEIEFAITPLEANKSSIEWSSSDESVAKVSSEGVIQSFAKEGVATITARLSNGDEHMFTIMVSQYSEAPAVKEIPEQRVQQGDLFSVIDLENYFTPYNDEILTYDIVIPANSKLFGVMSGVKGNICRVTVSDPAWSGSETLIIKARNDKGMESSVEVVFTVLEVVGITQAPQTKINAYPTITSAHCTVSITPAAPSMYTLLLYNIEGRLIESHQFYAAETVNKTIDFSRRAHGIYTCVIVSNSEKQSVKIVVE